MKEFGIYILKPNYIAKFGDIANRQMNNTQGMKMETRPCVCIKIENKNWLVPLSSLDPRNKNYKRRLRRYNTLNILDKRNPPKAIDVFKDLLKKGIKNYKDVALYYDAIPVKTKYCRPYRNITGAQVVISDNNIRNTLKNNLESYLEITRNGELTGFIKHKVEVSKELKYLNFPINCFDLQDVVYKEHNEIKAAHKYRSKQIEEHKQTQHYQKDLKNLYLERGEFAPYQDLSSVSQPDLSGYVGKESDAVISKETQQDLHTTQNKNQPQQVRQVGQVEQVGLVGQVGQARKSQNNVKQKAKAPNSAGKR